MLLGDLIIVSIFVSIIILTPASPGQHRHPRRAYHGRGPDYVGAPRLAGGMRAQPVAKDGARKFQKGSLHGSGTNNEFREEKYGIIPCFEWKVYQQWMLYLFIYCLFLDDITLNLYLLLDYMNS